MLLLAPLNVMARDTMHLLELLVLGWFWLTPILYQYERAVPSSSNATASRGEVLLLNPFTSVVITFQRAIYGTSRGGRASPCCPTTARCGTSAILLRHRPRSPSIILAVALRVFDRADANLAEAL